MFDSKKFIDLLHEYKGVPVAFVFYDRFQKKYGPLNVCNSINEVVFNACNYLKSVQQNNISLSHIDVYIAGTAFVDCCVYNLIEPVLFFNGSFYDEVYDTVLQEV